MARVRCENGHFYDTDKHRMCPYCGVPDLDIGGPTRPKPRDIPGKEKAPERIPTRPSPGDKAKKYELRPQAQDEEVATIGLFRKKKGFDPVVGWLVCVDGPDKGRDYRIHSERNFIGRSETMDIVISGDQTVSRENHAIISYDPKNRLFKLSPGDSRSLVYIGASMVDYPSELKPYDLIELGETKLMFVPLCGEHFQWE